MSNVSTAVLDTFRLPGNVTKPVMGPVIASTTTIAPSYPVHHISGTNAIATITPPGVDFCGWLVLIADAAFTTTTAGNIAIALTAVASQVVHLFYDPLNSKWYPSKY